MKICVLFPGQGFQKFGMLSKLAGSNNSIVKHVLEQCDEALPQLELSRLLLGQGEETDITSTELAQPLLLAHGIAHFRAWNQTITTKDVSFGAGHSLGEFTAYVAADLLPLKEALQLVHARGNAMKSAALESAAPTGMTSIIKPKQLDSNQWSSILKNAAQSHNVDIAAYNSPGLTVLSGQKSDIEQTLAQLKQNEILSSAKARVLAKPLPVSAAFHSRYMKSAGHKLSSLVQNSPWQPLEAAKFKVISNVTGKPYSSLEEIQRCCVEALTNPVHWQQSMEYAVQNHVNEFVAMGADIQKLMEKHVEAKSEIFN